MHENCYKTNPAPPPQHFIAKPMIDALFDFPDLLLTNILVEWIDTADIGRLDSACCLHRQRDYFLSIVSSDQFIVPSMDATPTHKTINYLEWHTKRRVKFSSLELHDVVNLRPHTSTLCAFFGAVGGPHVRSIHLHNTEDTGEHCDLSILFALISTNCRSICQVRVENCSLQSFGALLHMSSATLTSIQLIGCECVKDEKDYRGLQLPNLSMLYFCSLTSWSWTNHVTDNLVSASVALTEVNLLHLRVTKAFLDRLSQRAASLRLFSCQDLNFSSSNDLIDFSRACVALERLQLVYNGGSPLHFIDDDCISSFMTHCPLLVDIRLAGPFSNAVLSAIADHCGPRLRILSLSESVLVDSHGVDALANACHNIESLQVRRQKVWNTNNSFSELFNEALARLIRAQTRLLGLSLSLQDINAGVIEAVASHGAHLTYLNLFRTTGYTHAGLVKLALQCVALKTAAYCERNAITSETVMCWWRAIAPKVKFVNQNMTSLHWAIPMYEE